MWFHVGWENFISNLQYDVFYLISCNAKKCCCSMLHFSGLTLDLSKKYFGFLKQEWIDIESSEEFSASKVNILA